MNDTPDPPQPPGDGPRIVGYHEYVDLPAWGIKRLLAKADTGARSSALDARNIQELPGERVRFEVARSRDNRQDAVAVEAPIVRRASVRDSHGNTSERLVVEAEIKIGDQTLKREVTLVSREQMICRMLLGRQALSSEFLVDSSRRFVQSRPPRKRRSSEAPNPTGDQP
ncbi:ATP-dependent zinc protease family protein [Algisphaera agarilytica]|uniref:Retropepsin-like aspartic endopeptidase domain-containing protein n=1 Tax=Algisphaera agarilytica TaxID=1385975 RepID=A0A7X0H5P8_9BACT|nr:RimK/LysX family protein [Algisphaera agarilytica]MBB6429761.1 hypothetical protein [Algisphaera agarilytica]